MVAQLQSRIQRVKWILLVDSLVTSVGAHLSVSYVRLREHLFVKPILYLR